MPQPSKRVCITGINGFTGQALVPLLRGRGWEVCGIGMGPTPRNMPYLDIELGRTAEIAAWLAETRPTHILHLAARSHVVGDPTGFFQVNVLGTESLLDALDMAGLDLRRVIIASSANVYGNADKLPIDELAPLRPANHYAVSKASMELLVAGRERIAPLIVTRPFNYIGPGQSARFVVSKIVKAFRERAPTISLGNIDVRRDMSDIRMVSEAYVRLLDLPASVDKAVFNLCSGSAISIRAIIETMIGIASYSPEIILDPQLVRRNEVIELTGNPDKLNSFIGTLPSFTLTETLTAIYHEPT